MEFKDKTAIKLLHKVRSYELEDHIKTYPEDELDGMSDMQILADETSWTLSCYFEDGHCLNEDLFYAQHILRDTKYGKVWPIDGILSGKPKPRYSEGDVEWAKDQVNEVNRLKRLLKKLQGMGYYGSWYTV